MLDQPSATTRQDRAIVVGVPRAPLASQCNPVSPVRSFPDSDEFAHELRTPLTVIKEYASLVRDGLAGPVNVEQRRCLDVVADRVDELSAVVSEMLDADKLNSGTLTVWRRPTPVDEVLRHAAALVGRKIASRGGRIKLEVAPDTPAVWCDMDRIAGVLRSLCIEDVRRLREGSTVQFHAGTLAPGVVSLDVHVDATPGDCTDRASARVAQDIVRLHWGSIEVRNAFGGARRYSVALPDADPRALLAAYRRFAVSGVATLPSATLVCALLASAEHASATSVIDEFLQTSVDSRQFVCRLGTAHWLMATPGDAQVAHAWIARLARLWEDVARTWPYGQPPTIQWELRGSWAGETAWQGLSGQFDREMAELEATGRVELSRMSAACRAQVAALNATARTIAQRS